MKDGVLNATGKVNRASEVKEKHEIHNAEVVLPNVIQLNK